jgi:putative membrane protein
MAETPIGHTAGVDERDRLDVDVRFLLANERTLLAWLRTALTLLAGGVALIYLNVELFGLGIVLLALGLLAAIIGYRRYEAADRAIRAGRMMARGQGPALITAGVVVVAILLVVGVFAFRPS